MASSAKSTLPESSSSQLLARFEAVVVPLVPAGATVCVALSGGLDSVVLLDLFCRLRGAHGWRVEALHVHHGLSPNADGWASFCQRLGRRRKVPVQVVRVDLSSLAHLGLEAAARLRRYEAFARSGAGHVALAHHADDQAETVLLQLLRGSGVAGLAAMPLVRPLSASLVVKAGAAMSPEEVGTPQLLIRPLLGFRRSMIAAYARTRRLGWIEDESNQDVARVRNALRHDILPRLAQIQPAVVENINRSAQHLGSALTVLEEAAHADLAIAAGESARRSVSGPGAASPLDCRALDAMGEARATHAVKAWLEAHGVRAPSTAQFRQIWLQASAARPDAQVAINLEGAVLRRYRGALHLERGRVSGGANPARFEPVAWEGGLEWRIDDLAGTLRFMPTIGAGLAERGLRPPGRLAVIARPVGRLKLTGTRHHRSLKVLFQEAGVPAWVRARLPCLAIDGALAWVAGLGVAAQFAAGADEPGLMPNWHPDQPSAPI
jgi:tRNA(Ile)-lysidine synthase